MQKGRKVVQCFVAPEDRKVGLLKRRVGSYLGRWDQKLHAVVARSTFGSENGKNTAGSEHFWKLSCWKGAMLWHEAHFEAKMLKAHHARSTFGSWDAQKVHGIVARSTRRSQNVQNTPLSEQFWNLRWCWKNAGHCGAKHVSKWKVLKTNGLGALLEVEMSKKCTALWREAHSEVKSVKNWRSRATFGSSGLEKVHAAVAQSTFATEKCEQLTVSNNFWNFWKLRYRKSARCCGGKHISKWKVFKTGGLRALLEREREIEREREKIDVATWSLGS